MKPTLMTDSLPMNGDLHLGLMPIWMISLLVLFYVVLYIGIPFLIILSARSNWRTLHEKESVVEFVGFWRRMAISIVDMALMMLIVPLFFNLCYYLRDGQTIGDKIYGTKLVDKKSLKTATVGQLWIRGIAKILSMFPFGFGFITAGWRSEKRAWHDGLADVRYISHKKVHSFWTWFPFLILIVLFAAVPIVIGAIHGYQEAGMPAVEMAM
jgi:uncharacterized RDD family membrane protein YckC